MITCGWLLVSSKKEEMKLKCGTTHFREFADVKYRPVSAFNDLIDPV